LAGRVDGPHLMLLQGRLGSPDTGGNAFFGCCGKVARVQLHDRRPVPASRTAPPARRDPQQTRPVAHVGHTRHQHEAGREGLANTDLDCPRQVRDMPGELQRRGGQAPQHDVACPAGQGALLGGQRNDPGQQIRATPNNV